MSPLPPVEPINWGFIAIVGVTVVAAFWILRIILLWRRRRTVLPKNEITIGPAPYAYADFKRDLLNPEVQVEEILDRCQGRVPQVPAQTCGVSKPQMEIEFLPGTDGPGSSQSLGGPPGALPDPSVLIIGAAGLALMTYLMGKK